VLQTFKGKPNAATLCHTHPPLSIWPGLRARVACGCTSSSAAGVPHKDWCVKSAVYMHHHICRYMYIELDLDQVWHVCASRECGIPHCRAAPALVTLQSTTSTSTCHTAEHHQHQHLSHCRAPPAPALVTLQSTTSTSTCHTTCHRDHQPPPHSHARDWPLRTKMH